MDIFKTSFNPPQTLTTERFCLFPTNQFFSASDFEAVMANKELLRNWSQSSWPEDDFTLKQNHEDLGQHVQDNIDHTAYGYMLYSLDKEVCYGSVYINPLSKTPEYYHTTEAERSVLLAHHARIDCWIIEDSSDLEKTILIELRKWFKETWKINPLFSARVQLEKRIQLYEELGMKKQLDLKSQTSEMTLLLF